MELEVGLEVDLRVELEVELEVGLGVQHFLGFLLRKTLSFAI